MRLNILYWRIRLGWRSVIDNHYARRAYRRGWRVDLDGWFYRPVRAGDPPADAFAISGNAFIAGEEEVAVKLCDCCDKPARGCRVEPGAYLFCRDGQQALALDKGKMV